LLQENNLAKTQSRKDRRGKQRNTFGGLTRSGMFFGMATSKITITLRQDQVKEIRALITAGRAASVSGFVQHAVSVALSDAAEWQGMLKDALEQTGGPLTDKERAWADRILSPRPAREGRKGKAA
jgi:Arc/MetJ-type ribon-helix-helix transcriptional regulator